MEIVYGDPPPLPADVSVRVYNMEYCPFAQRVLLALSAKGIKYDVINCCLGPNKPQFLNDANPNGEVPVLLHGGHVLYESDIIVDYVDRAFPGGHRLYQDNAISVAKGRLLVKMFDTKVIPLFYKLVFYPNHENQGKLLDALETWIENPLEELDTPFFGGQDYSFVDVNCWPWIERIHAMKDVGFISLGEERFPKLFDYANRMIASPGISEWVHTGEEYKTFYDSYRKGNPRYNYHAKRPMYCKGKRA